MVVLCAGMFRSGSTWQYQVACDLARRSRRPMWKHGARLAAEVLTIVRTALDYDGIHIVKTHVPDPALREYFGHPGFRVLYSYRDLRDIAFSMAYKIADTFDVTVHKWHFLDQCLSLEKFWKPVPRKVVQRYERWREDPRPFVTQIAACLDIEVTPAIVNAVCEEYNLEKQKQRTELLASELRHRGVDVTNKQYALASDPESLLHWNHIREGRIGHWRALATPEQRLELLQICGDWLIAQGYETNNNWAFADEKPAA